MDPNESRNESVAEGLVEAVAEANHEVYTSRGQADKAASDPAATGATGAQNAHTEKQKEKQEKVNTADEDSEAGDNSDGLDRTDFSRQPIPKEESQDEEQVDDDATSQEETTVVDDTEWQKYLPAVPGDFTLNPPEPDDLGRVDPEEYTNYLEKKLEYNADVKAYNRAVITNAFEAAEKVLPELKTNPGLQNIVKQTYLADLRDGKTDANPVTIARALKESFNSKVAEGVANTQTQIEVQKNATVEKTGATKRKVSTKKTDDFDRRLARNDTAAFEDLMGTWMDEKKI